jgi:hypothetical protein
MMAPIFGGLLWTAFGATFLPLATRAYRVLTVARVHCALTVTRAYRALTTNRS